MPRQNNYNIGSYNSSPTGDPLTNEIIEYDRTHCPIRNKRIRNTKTFASLVIGLFLIAVLLLLGYLFADDSDLEMVCLVFLIICLVGLAATIIWYPIFMHMTKKAYQEENEAIEQWTRERLKRAAEESKAANEVKSMPSSSGDTTHKNEWLNK